MRLRRTDLSAPGFTRRRSGTGFSYLGLDGNVIKDAEIVERIKALVIPPAWRDVWICPWPNGHIQAVGIDAAGRRQYLYHPEWRVKRDAMKFDHVLQVARKLPKARIAILEHLALDGMPEQRAAATAVRLLDLGYFRIGSDAYTDAHGSFGLTTLERRHVSRRGGLLVFSFVGKSGKEHCIEIDDPLSVAAVETMRRRRGGSDRLLAFKDDRHWVDLDAGRVNDYLRESTGTEITAKDFRTWHATVLAAAALGATDDKATSRTARAKAVREAMNEVATYLGNTATIAKSSYVDPRVLDLYESGTTIAPALNKRYRGPGERQAGLERAVLRMLA
jgi:DNA topoisomerase IB